MEEHILGTIVPLQYMNVENILIYMTHWHDRLPVVAKLVEYVDICHLHSNHHLQNALVIVYEKI